jgi:hypothetical protein
MENITDSLPASAPEAPPELPMRGVRHVVVFSFRPATTEGKIRRVTDAFRDLRNRVPGMLSFEHGANNSPEGLNLGFTHAYTLTFESAEARDLFVLPHPAHAEFIELAKCMGMVNAFVVDYVPEP